MDNQKEKSGLNEDGLNKGQEGVPQSGSENYNKNVDNEESVYETEDEETEDAKDKKAERGL